MILAKVQLKFLTCLGLALVTMAPLMATADLSPKIRLVPQEIYGEEVLSLLNRKPQEGIQVLQFSFFTDNNGESYPKKIAQHLMDIRRQIPDAPITVAMESRKKEVALRNAKTKKMLTDAGIEVRDVYGSGGQGVSHAKLVMVGDEVIAGSTNLSKQSTDIAANNEMNIGIRSEKIAKALRDFVGKVVARPEQMAEIEVEDGNVRLLTDRLHFDELLGQIRLAQKGHQLGLSMYQFLYRNEDDAQAKQVLEELLSAHKRGVQLEIFLNRAEELSSQNTFANLRVAELLMQQGVNKVYFDPEAKISHSKFLYRISASEKVAMISSVNIYRGDFNDNHQLTWVIRNDVVVDELMSYFKQQIAYDGVLVSRIEKDPSTGLRYRVVSGNPGKSIWNPVGPATRMLRFWRGFKQGGVSRVDFETNVNSRLIPETIEVAGGRGLSAYLPSFFSEGKPAFLPDEVAIIDYADEEKYNAIRTTERGKKYGPLHFEPGLFAKENSSSLIAAVYKGTVEVRQEGRAYMLGSSDLNWQQGVSVRRTLVPTTQELSAVVAQRYFSNLEGQFKRLGVGGVVAIVEPRYILLMLNAQDQQSARNLSSALTQLELGIFNSIDHIIFENQMHGATHLAPGSGINIRYLSPFGNPPHHR